MVSTRTRTHRSIALAAWLALGGGMHHEKTPPPPAQNAAPARDDLVTVRYQVTDIARSIAFYTEPLGFQPAERAGSMFAAVRRGNLRLILGGPGSSGSRPLPDRRKQE